MRPSIVVGSGISVVSICWGILFLMYPDMFERSPQYWNLLKYAGPEWMYAIIVFSIALMKVIGIKFNRPKLLKLGLIASTIWWIAVAVFTMFGSGKLYFSTMTVSYLFYAILSLWVSKEVGDDVVDNPNQ